MAPDGALPDQDAALGSDSGNASDASESRIDASLALMDGGSQREDAGHIPFDGGPADSGSSTVDPDASAPGFDASLAQQDAGFPVADVGPQSIDAGVPPPDAAAPAAADAGAQELDAGALRADAAAPARDAGLRPPDGGSAQPDAASSSEDASVSRPDAGGAGVDGGLMKPDAGTPVSDGGAEPPDAGLVADSGTSTDAATILGNDRCATPVKLVFTSGVTSASGDTSFARDDYFGTCGGTGRDLAYTFSTVGQGENDIDIVVTPRAWASSYQPTVYVRRICDSSAAADSLGCASAPTAGSASKLYIPRAPEGDYALVVDGFASSAGEFELTVTLTPPSSRPANDGCAGAARLSFTYGLATAIGDTRPASHDTSGSCSPSGTARDVVYLFSLASPQSVTAKVTVEPSTPTFTPVVYLRAACGSAALADERGCGTAGYPGATASVFAASLAAGTYYVWVDGVAGNSGKFNLQVTLTAPLPSPSNDTCARAETLLFANDVAVALGDTTLAKSDTRSLGCYVGDGNDVVYTFTTVSPKDVTATVTPKTGSRLSPVLYLRKGACGSVLRSDELACDDAPIAGYPVTIRTRVQAGTHFVYVDGYAGSAGLFDLQVALANPPPPPPNDSCTAPSPLTFTNDAATATGDTRSAADDARATCSAGSGPDVVHSFTLPASHSVYARVSADASTPTYSPVVYVRSSCASAAAADEKGCRSFSGSVASTSVMTLAAGTYFVWVDGSSGAAGRFLLEVFRSPLGALPRNDTCSTAEKLSFSSNVATVSSDTAFARNDTWGTCGGTGNDLVYSLETTAEQSLSIAVTPKSPASAFRPVVYVRKGACTSSLTSDSLGCAEAPAAGQSASLFVPFVPRGTHYLFVDGAIGTVGAFDLTVALGPPVSPPVNDSCAQPEVLNVTPGTPTTVRGTTATARGNTSGSCLLLTGPDVVYSLTTGAEHRISVNVKPDTGSLGPHLYVRKTCSSTASADELACGSSPAGKPLTVDIPRAPKGTYFIWVDSFTGAGGYSLTAELLPPVPPPANDGCAGATALSLGAPVSGTTYGAADDFGTGLPTLQCRAIFDALSGPDVVFAYTTSASATGYATVTVTPLSATFDPVVWVMSRACRSELSMCIAAADSGLGGKAEALRFPVARSTTYYIVVDSYDRNAGAFTIEVR